MQQYHPDAHGQHLRPHRGAMILVFGILGIVLCFVFGIIAWVMGNDDIRQMNAGLMDPAGRDMTQIGRIMGIVVTCIVGGGILLYAFFMLLMLLVAAIGIGSFSP